MYTCMYREVDTITETPEYIMQSSATTILRVSTKNTIINFTAEVSITELLSGVPVFLASSVCVCACVCLCVSDGVDILCREQHRVDASFTWQLQGSSDVSESAEALIRTRVNHCSGNPEKIEAAWGEVSQASGRLHHRRPATLQ